MLQRFRLGANKLAREITITLILKIIVLLAIWYFFFSHPITDSLTQDNIRHQILGYKLSAEPSRLLSSFNLNHYRAVGGDNTWSPRV